MSWTKAALTGMDVETTDPIKLIIAKAEIDQPAEKQTKVLKEAAGVASLISSLMGKDKTAQKIQKYSDKVPTKISLQNIRYENGKLSAAGISSASIEGLILQKLSDAMGENWAVQPPQLNNPEAVRRPISSPRTATAQNAYHRNSRITDP